MLARTLMVQGTSSSVGKSLLVTALCRIFAREGVRVAPYKSQNLSLNAFVTSAGGEIGRAQAVQATACGIEPTVDMNPILLKPEGRQRLQVVLRGRSVGSLTAGGREGFRSQMAAVVAGSLRRLREEHELVIIEGAGSPAEVNLQARDIANMFVARLADAPVLLVGDIDRGGVFAALVGTLALLPREDRQRVAALVINKFRGDLGLLGPGLAWLSAETGLPVLGTVGYIEGLRIADEDSVALEGRRGRQAGPGQLDIAVLRLPHISNHDDFDGFEREPGVVLRYVAHADQLGRADLVVLPGSKQTRGDLAWLRASGFERPLQARIAVGDPVLGICAGCQMLGTTIEDPQGVEAAAGAAVGLGALPLRTRFERDKRTSQVTARVGAASFLSRGVPADLVLSGYQIHMGRVRADAAPAFTLLGPDAGPDGAVSACGAVVGTMVHGILDNDVLRGALLRSLWERRGRTAAPAIALDRQAEYDRLADVVGAAFDMPLLLGLVGGLTVAGR